MKLIYMTPSLFSYTEFVLINERVNNVFRNPLTEKNVTCQF